MAHFFKSGNVLRKKDAHGLIDLKTFLPKKWSNNTKVEYDIWYSFNDNKIHGYVYTDLLTQFIYLRVASEKLATEAMGKAAQSEVTKEGERLFAEIAKNCEDKYRLRPSRNAYDFVIFLAGSNILGKVTDWGKIDNAVSQGAKLKCHPLTSAPAYQHLVHKYGDAVIEKKISGHQLLEEAAIVGCCDNSEMGLAALSKGKTVYRFGKADEWCTYSAIYRALDVKGQLSQKRLKAILSNKCSGLIPANVGKPHDRVMQFFYQYEGYEHVAPKNFGDRVQQARIANH
ncbi:MAG: hypothetical protein KJO69_06950 [Gammaproteobacteria bacterium]|nr:hypothetical protein [Gammaproteobacteria bacterium]